jgi:nucleolar protein 14
MKGPKPGNRIGHQPAAAKKKSEKPNPFEIKRSKTKFETLGRRLKGASKNVIKAREDSVTKRKNTLLVEYKQLRKANTFVDRRFGGVCV